jgi:hypothetical protein
VKQRKLSTASSRAELIASYAYGTQPPPAKPADPPADPKAPAPTEDVDAEVTEAVATAKAAVDKALALQEKDPDASTDPHDKAVLEGLQTAASTLTAVEKAQGEDVAGEKPAEPAPDKAPPVPPKATTAAAPPPPKVDAPANPVDKDGNVDDNHVCANPDCQHLGSAHGDGSEGKNTGPCSMENCECPGMQVASHENDQPEEDETEEAGQPSKLGDEDLALPGAPAVPGAAQTDDATDSSLNAPPEIAGGDSMGPAFTIPVAIIEGQPTGDGRQIAVDALTWRTPPLPLMGMATETHDPEGFDMNDPSVICGRIDGFAREPGEGSTAIITAKGFFLPNDDGMYFAEMCEAMGRLGVSADVAVQASDITIDAVDDMGFPTDMSEILTEGTLMGVTVCPFPAFEGAYIVLGDGTEKPEAQTIPQATEKPVVPDAPPAAVTAGGQLIHFMTYEECEACDQGFEVIAASGAGPERPPRDWFSNPNFTEGDGRLVEILDKRGQRALGGKFACPITVTDDGRLFGHIAPWGVCHTGVSGTCVLAPKSAVNYAHFKRGQQITTAEGEQIRVGIITADTGHASTRPGVSASAAMAHYDNTALQIADVNVGEDEYGIWVAGAVRPEATEAQIRKLTASSISGDWRAMGGQLELVAALAVNQPGFPLAVIDEGHREAVIAAGATVMDRLKHPVEKRPAKGDTALRAALGPLLDTAKDRARERIAALTVR